MPANFNVTPDTPAPIPSPGLGLRWLACWLLLTLLGWYGVTLMPLARTLAGETGPPLTGEPPSAFILFGLNAGLALLGALTWGRAEGDRGWTARAAPWIMRAARLSLAYVLFIYGWQKVFLLQMPRPENTDLLTRFGEMNHMGLLWRTVGASPVFQFVGGALEVLSAFLLLHRRTALAGALLAVPVMSFVLLLNLSFNVFVKLGAANLLLLAVAILWPHLPNLWRAVRNEPTRPLPAPPGLPGSRPLRALARVAVLGYVLAAPLQNNLTFVQRWSPRPVPHDLAGVYRVTADSRPAPDIANDCRWRTLALNAHRTSLAPLYRTEWMNCPHDPATGAGRYEVNGQTLTLTPAGGSPQRLRWARQGAQLTLTGQDSGTPFTVTLEPAPARDTRLLNDHWRLFVTPAANE
ncbi:hypothetical protein [Deinococcus sp. JMULE3]|uniref:hypothetical protein n=1 Tax=Deinococcus sp. JMULE3 TaxID=2518341 RepID=UPI00157739C8|nr:hypothetical protein [Deinococcus sp. JMULE3]NTY02298.1 hypothetical protein [Deinococcus sp. JMULE3]